MPSASSRLILSPWPGYISRNPAIASLPHAYGLHAVKGGFPMAKYVDGFVIPIKKANLAAYKKMAKLGRKVWMEHGALEYVECVGDQIDGSSAPSFKQMCKLKANETAIFAYVVYKSKAD